MEEQSKEWIEQEVRDLLSLGSGDRDTATLLIEHLASKIAPSMFIHLIPAGVRQALEAACACPPKSIDDFDFIEGGVYRASAFEGLTQQQAQEKIRQRHQERKQRRLDGMRAFHRYFQGVAGDQS